MKKIILFSIILFSNYSFSVESFCPKGTNPDSNVLFCESFERAGSSESSIDFQPYFVATDDNGSLTRTTEESIQGSHSAKANWSQGAINAGSFQINFGRHPFSSQINSKEDIREIYWRMYVKYPSNFVNYPSKYSRLMIMADNNWAQAMIAHVWGHSGNEALLKSDPATGVVNNVLKTTKWNDFANLKWLGAKFAKTSMTKGQWICLEAHVKLNDAGMSNGIFELFINDQQETTDNGLNWVGNWNQYGLNSILFSNYWNGGSSVAQSRFIDAIVISKNKIGCLNSNQKQPKEPTNIIVNH